MLINMPGTDLYHIKHTYEEHPMQSDFLMHAHSHYELLLFISGDITYLVEGKSYRPKPYDILLFDIAETHKVIVHSDTPYERFVIQMDKKLFGDTVDSNIIFSPFTHRIPGENNILHESDFEDGLWKICLTRLMRQNIGDRTDVVSLVLPLLNEIRKVFPQTEAHRDHTPLALNLLLYINDHITEDISPEEVAQHFFISRTSLYAVFKKATGTSIHNYVNVKRLIMAQDMLRQNEKPTRVYEKCGFNDYTTFYRAYKKLFARSPENEQNN